MFHEQSFSELVLYDGNSERIRNNNFLEMIDSISIDMIAVSDFTDRNLYRPYNTEYYRDRPYNVSP